MKLSGLKGDGFFTIVDEEDYISFNLDSYRWRFGYGRNGTVYARTKKNGKTILLHRLIMGLTDASRVIMVDHIDHDGLNNSRDNLRLTNNGGNQFNRRKTLLTKASSSYKGVCLRSGKRDNRWEAHITLSGKRKYLGRYKTEVEAATAYNKVAKELFDFPLLNDLPLP
jgi:hypothetical protein